MSLKRVAVDVGGTFTDVCVLDETTGSIAIGKVRSTADPRDGVLEALGSVGVDLSNVTFFSHGTTMPTNALITRRLPPAAMVTTRGFRDVIEIRRGTKDKDDLWDAYRDVAPPYIRRRDRLSVTERVDYSGRVLTPLDEDEARRVAHIIRRRGMATVAVCFMNSFVNPAHEIRMREILEEELPGVSISTSSEVLPEIFEHDRFSTTVGNTLLSPLVAQYVRDLEGDLQERGYTGDLLMIHSGGGVMTPATAERFAVRLAGSGIAAGAIASRHIAMLCGYENSIGLDMGGTSADISLAYEGELRITKEWSVQFGYPICFPSIEVLTIGAGGGSLAWIDEAGSLRNGPQSAGADPGPACYGLGNEDPTNTDANVVLGRLGDELIGGELTLDGSLAADAVHTGAARPLGLEVAQAAQAIIEVANANMADAIRLLSIRRGYDPRDFALVVFGGAGALHGAALARELAIPTVLVPPNPGIASALGCLLVDVRHDLSVMFLAGADEATIDEIENEFTRLEAEARDRLQVEGIPEARMHLQRSIDMRYVGQWRSLDITVGAPLTSLGDALASFHERHACEHNYRRDKTPVEIYRLNVVAVGVTQKAELELHSPNGASFGPRAARPVWFHGSDSPIDTPVYWRGDLPAGAVVEGPVVLEQIDSTVLVPPGVTAAVDERLTIRMQIPAGA